MDALEILTLEQQKFEKQVKPTTTDGRQFERNCKNDWLSERLKGLVSLITEHKNLIGKEAYKFQRSGSYTTLADYNTKCALSSSHKNLNPIEPTPILFSELHYEQFVKYYLEYQLKYYTKELTERSITCNSSDKITNIQFEWQLECKQEVMKICTGILERLDK